jgi:hypothetical protein
MKEVVELNNFMKHLKDNDLMIVRKDDYFKKKDLELVRIQRAFFRRKNVTFQEIIDAKVLKVTTKQALLYWLKIGTIRADEHYKNSQGHNMIRVEGIKRILKDPKRQSIFYQK